MKINDIEAVFEIPMTKSKITEMLKQVEMAEKTALPGQKLIVKVSHNIAFSFNEVSASDFFSAREKTPMIGANA